MCAPYALTGSGVVDLGVALDSGDHDCILTMVSEVLQLKHTLLLDKKAFISRPTTLR
ncbi:hypothetical protein FACS1894202_10780 [Clostridia bacterium]|nr:hypothetical protein FACS1894202_10780 [Clostridia bacterium]